MKLNKNILAILSIVCVILLAVAVSATQHTNDVGSVINPTQDGHNATIISPYMNHNEAALHSQANSPNITYHAPAAGKVVKNIFVHASEAKLPATGNPVLALIAISAVLGGATLIARKK